MPCARRATISKRPLERDLWVLRLLDAVPRLDPFLLREHLRNNQIEVSPSYFAISEGDQDAHVPLSSNRKWPSWSCWRAATPLPAALVSALLSNQIDEKLEPLRLTLGLTGNDFREGVFSWRGFLYYKWSMGKFWPDVISVLREINKIQPVGAAVAGPEGLSCRRRAAPSSRWCATMAIM